VAGANPLQADRVRLGVIGTGDRGRTLIRNIAKTRNCVVAALCDDYAPHLAKGRALVGASTPVFADHRAMLDAGGIDAVVIATPLHVHARHSFDAFDAGLHVWCEKAMARTIADCSAMVKRSQDSRKVLQIGHQRMFNPTYLNALRRVKAGEIGPVTQIRASWHRNTSWRRPVPPTAASAGSTGGCIAKARPG
jgi:predicted dehydrogenase